MSSGEEWAYGSDAELERGTGAILTATRNQPGPTAVMLGGSVVESDITAASISRQAPRIPHPTSEVSLNQLQIFVEVAKGTTEWNEEVGHNPLYTFQIDPMVHLQVMDMLVFYLLHHSYFNHGMRHSVAVVPPSVYLMTLHAEHRCGNNSDAIQTVWQHDGLPSYIVVPVIRDGHWYVWHGPVTHIPADGWECELHHLCSLGAPRQDTLLQRMKDVETVLRFIFPGLTAYTMSHQHVPGYRQAPNSLDCGLFVAQAVSAIVFKQPGSLTNLLPVHEIKSRIIGILQACKDGILERISLGYRPDTAIVLHNHQQAPEEWSGVRARRQSA